MIPLLTPKQILTILQPKTPPAKVPFEDLADQAAILRPDPERRRVHKFMVNLVVSERTRGLDLDSFQALLTVAAEAAAAQSSLGGPLPKAFICREEQ